HQRQFEPSDRAPPVSRHAQQSLSRSCAPRPRDLRPLRRAVQFRFSGAAVRHHDVENLPPGTAAEETRCAMYCRPMGRLITSALELRFVKWGDPNARLPTTPSEPKLSWGLI